MVKKLTMISIVLLVLLAGLGNVHAAKVEVHEFKSEQHEDTYKSLIAKLRCLVCQNQNIADSNAELAVDLRRKTYEMVQKDLSEEQIVDFMVDRYGDFVMYKPRMSGKTLWLWVLPFVFLFVAVVFLLRTIARRKASVNTSDVVDQEAINRASSILADKDKN